MPGSGQSPFLSGLGAALEEQGVQTADLSRASLARMLRHRIAGYRILHVQGMPFSDPSDLRRLLRWAALLGLHIVWDIGSALPRGARAQDVENLRSLYLAARVRIVSSQEVRGRLRDDFGLDGTTFVVSPTEPMDRLVAGTRLAYETSLEAPMPTEDRARPPRA